MESRQKYVMNHETMVILPEYDEGELCSRIQEASCTYVIRKSPKSVIESSLLYFASSLSGAIEGSKALLGNHNMIPIVVSETLDMYWFPTHSPEHKDCIWFSLKYIENIEQVDPTHTKIFFKNGDSIILSMKAARLRTRVERTAKLKIIVQEHTQLCKNFLYIPKKGIMYVKEPGKKNYRRKRKE